MIKKITLILLTLMFTSLIVVGAVNLKNKEVKAKDDTMEIINSINEEPIIRSDIICDEHFCYQRIQKGEYSIGSIKTIRYECEEWEYRSDDEIQEMKECVKYKERTESEIMDNLLLEQQYKLEEKAKKIKEKQAENNNKKVITDSGEITLSQLA